MSYAFHITNQGIVVIDAASVVNGVNGQALLSISRNSADNLAPIINGGLDTQTFSDFLVDISRSDMSALTRDFTASALGTMAGMIAMPLGPATATVVDQFFSEAFKRAYDSARAWSQEQDWNQFSSVMQQYSSRGCGLFDTSKLDPDTLLPIDPNANTAFNAARGGFARRDPLVLDLDGDGIEAVGIDPAHPILFDHDGDGVKNATGWIKADDGLVVLDRNGNAVIDSGAELFGDSTILANGLRAGKLASNGFEALGDLDFNQDGAINSTDAAYTQLRIWQDANQDGVSQASELQTLSAVAWPQMQGSGQVRDLREAMSLGTADATSLQTKVAAFAAATTRDAQMAEVDGILTDWAKTSGQLLSSTYKYNLNASGSLQSVGVDGIKRMPPELTVLTVYSKTIANNLYGTCCGGIFGMNFSRHECSINGVYRSVCVHRLTGSTPRRSSNFLSRRRKKVTKGHTVGICSLRAAKLCEYQRATLVPVRPGRTSTAVLSLGGVSLNSLRSNRREPLSAQHCATRHGHKGTRVKSCGVACTPRARRMDEQTIRMATRIAV